MAALTGPRTTRETRLKTIPLPLKAGVKAWQGGRAAGDTADGTVKPAVSGVNTLISIGEFEDSVDNSAGTTTVNALVSLDHEVVARWYDNATGAGAITAANLFGDVYLLDDHTVTATAGSNSKAGRVWAVDSTNGVAVEAYTL